ncbi:MAG TPA: hypothetical protein VH684_25830 [Xanthobacteraceae bacterium]|jgi:hypothetical protein
MGYAGCLNLCRALFDIPLIDYERPSYGLLIGSGAGIMMAMMDASARFRFALDLDACRGREDSLRAFIRALDRNGLIDLVALAGWFSITDPKPIAAALRGLSAPVIIYSGAGLARDAFGDIPFVDTLDEFLAHLQPQARPAPATPPELAGLAKPLAVLPLHAALTRHLNGHEPDAEENIEALAPASDHDAIAGLELAEEPVG